MKFIELSGKGISVMISTVLTFLFAVVMITIALNIVNPTFQRAQDMTTVGDAFQNLEIINNAIEEVSSESEGSKRTISVSVVDGTYRLDNTYDWVYFQFEPEQRISLSGIKGDVEVQRDQEFFDAFNWYVDGTTADGQWTNDTGQWIVSSYKYQGTNGTSYRNFSQTMESWGFSGDISNTSGPAGGQIFVLPTNPRRLAAFWPFDNSSGNKSYDYSGNSNNGSMPRMDLSGGNESSGWQNSTVCKAGVNCIVFDGEGDYVKIADSNTLDFTSENFTLSAWIKLNRLSGDTAIISKGIVITDGWFWEVKSNKKMYFVTAQAAAGQSSNSEADINIDTWYHVVVVRNGASVNFYVDGTNRTLVTTAAVNPLTNTREMWIGKYHGVTPNYFNGTMDEVMIFNTSLSAAEVAALYETSAKKLAVSGSKNIDTYTPNGAVVLANPDGTTKFDNILVTGSQKELKMVVPYINVDVNGTMRLPKGDHSVEIRHMGTNSTSNRPTVQLTNV